MPKSRKQPSIDEIIYGKGYIIEEGYNPLKKKKIKIYNTSPEQKKEFLIKKKVIQRAKKGKKIEKPKNPTVANKVVNEIVKSKKYSYVNRAMNPKSPTIDNQTMRTMGADGKLFPTIRRDKRGRLKKYSGKEAMKISQKNNDAIPVTDIAPTYVSTKDVSLALSDRVAKARGMKNGSAINSGCPHRENGVKSDIKGISDIQIKGKKFIGVK